jgi:single-strand DNA-binding protein
MARSVNLTILHGNVGADLEIRYTSSGTPVARFSLATNSQDTDMSTGELKKITPFHNLAMYTQSPPR